MFQSIGRGWVFIKQGWSLTQKSPALLIPTLMGLIVSVITLLVMTLPIAGLILYVRKNPWGQFSIGILIGLLLVILVAIISSTAIPSSNLAGAALSGQIPHTETAWKKVSTLGADIYWLGLGLPIRLIRMAIRRKYRSHKNHGWEDASHLLVPVLANEQITLREAPKLITRFQKDNCVFVADSVGIHKASGLIILGSLVIGLAAGFGLTWLVVTSGADIGRSYALAFCLAMLMLAIFTLPVALFCTYAITLFNTCLYLWGKSVRGARVSGTSADSSIPEPLAVALGVHSGR